jgi:hypothetical protein
MSDTKGVGKTVVFPQRKAVSETSVGKPRVSEESDSHHPLHEKLFPVKRISFSYDWSITSWHSHNQKSFECPDIMILQ